MVGTAGIEPTLHRPSTCGLCQIGLRTYWRDYGELNPGFLVDSEASVPLDHSLVRVYAGLGFEAPPRFDLPANRQDTKNITKWFPHSESHGSLTLIRRLFYF